MNPVRGEDIAAERKQVKILVRILAMAVILTPISCMNSLTEDQRFQALTNEYIEKLLAMKPELATGLGDHRYDHRLRDYTVSGIDEELRLHRRYLSLLSQIEPSQLSSVNKVDIRILTSNIESNIFQLETLREYSWNPLAYNIGGAVYDLTARNFAPLKERLSHVQERLRNLPSVIEAAKANLKNPPRIDTETAILQNKGNITMVRDELRTYLDQVPELRSEFVPIQTQAVTALEAYGNWLEKELLPRSNGDFRLGLTKFRSKLRYRLEADLSLEEILSRAQQDLAATQNTMFETAAPLYRRFFSREAKSKTLEDRRMIIKATLDKLAEMHPTNQNIVELATQSLQSTTEFVRQHQLVTVPDEPLKVIVMPEFKRGVSVAYCDSPGPLEIHGETFFAISPTPADWSPQRVESFFREYNSYMLQELTIHEAMPGHYLQLAHANKFKAPTLVRAIFSSGPFIEGWATYAEQLMVEKGFGGPEVKMQQLKMRLRLIINAILDQKIHTGGMTEKEAMDLMMNEGFQEEGEAAGKWRRACLTSTQLSTYYVGNTEMNDLRKDYEVKHGPITDFKAFHDALLSFGSPAPKYVKELMRL
jgi:uncharacterized protein (DUF885 family)